MEWKFVEPLKDAGAIAQVEAELGFKLPADLVELVKAHNNGAPVLDTFDTENRTGKAFGELLNFNLDAKYNILHEYSLIKDKLRPGMIPFAGDAGGNYLCLDTGSSATAPAVYYWDHEQLFEIEGDELNVPDHSQEYEYYHHVFVAENVQELLDKLYSDEDDEEDGERAEVIWEDFMDEEQLMELDDENFAAVNARRAQQGLDPMVR